MEAQRAVVAAAPALRPSLHGLAGKTVLLTGSGGSIGSELARQLAASSVGRLVLVDCCEAAQFRLQRSLSDSRAPLEFCLRDVTDPACADELFDRWRPHAALHAAAYKHVPLLESHPREAIRTNVLATKLLAAAAERSGCSAFVMISTDKAVAPVSVMGRTKRMAELYLRSRPARRMFSSVRFGNVIDSSGNVVETFQHQINRGGPVTLTDPRATRYFMTAREAAHLVLTSALSGGGGQTLVLDMGRRVRIEAIAREMIRIAGADIEVGIVGLRPGERLHEQLLGPGERLIATDHPRIGIAWSEPPEIDSVDSDIDQLQAALDEPAAVLRRLLSEAVRRHDPRGSVAPEVEVADANS